jgi:hypothetical protein
MITRQASVNQRIQRGVGAVWAPSISLPTEELNQATPSAQARLGIRTRRAISSSRMDITERYVGYRRAAITRLSILCQIRRAAPSG